MRGVVSSARWDDLGTLARFWTASVRDASREPTVHPNARCDGNAVIADDAVVGGGVTIGPESRVTASVVLEGASIGRGCRVYNAVIGEDVVIGDGASVEGKAVVMYRGERIEADIE